MRTVLCALALAMLLPAPARAWLGGDADSIRADAERMNSSARATAATSCTVYEMETPAGTRVREFVSPTGRVFAVTWQGASLPDLRQLLGAFFERYVTADNALGAGAASRVIDQPDFVVHAGGHLRAFVGRAYLPAAMPPGVALADLR